MALKPITIHGVDCVAERPETDCRRQTVVVGGTEPEALQAFRRDGWDNRDIGWLCPPCLAVYDRQVSKTGGDSSRDV